MRKQMPCLQQMMERKQEHRTPKQKGGETGVCRRGDVALDCVCVELLLEMEELQKQTTALEGAAVSLECA